MNPFTIVETEDELIHVYKDGDAAWAARYDYAGDGWRLGCYGGLHNCWCKWTHEVD